MLNSYLYFQLHRVLGSKIQDYYREFMEVERASAADLRALQSSRLDRVLRHAASHVPYYRGRVSASGALTLADFPVLTKDEIRANYHELMTDMLWEEYASLRRQRRLYSWTEVKTGGSTGVPTTVIHDQEWRDRGRASRLYTQHLCDFPLGRPYFRLWGNLKDINNTNASLQHRVASYLANETILNAYKMSDATIEAYLRQINTAPVDHMMVYADAAVQMGSYILRTGSAVKPLASIMSCASTLTTEMRQTLQQAFQCRIHNKYGSRDCTDMACECEHGGFHILSNQIVLEVVDADGQAVAPGETGRILVTMLFNDAFPLIRYEIGDMGALSDKLCPCGRPFPLLDRLEGRSAEFLLSNDGEYVLPSIVTSLIGIAHNPGFVQRFQLTQHTLYDYELALCVDDGAADDAYHDFIFKVRRDLKVVFGPASNIVITRVDEIEPTASGKYLYTQNKVQTLRNVASAA